MTWKIGKSPSWLKSSTHSSNGGGLGKGFNNFVGSISKGWDDISGKTAKEDSKQAAKQAAREAENVRRENIVKEFGVRQQADSLAYASSMNGQGPQNAGSSSAPGLVGQNDAAGLVGQTSAPGTIGSNISSSGTF